MSTESYAKWWIKSKAHLLKLRRIDVKNREEKPTKERPLAAHLIGGLYARYCMIVQEIDTCLDQMAQVQKRFTIRKLMDAATVRLNELKEELTKIDISEYHYVDGALVELKLIPHDVEILHPALFFPRPHVIQELWERIQKGEAIYVPPQTIVEVEPEDIEVKEVKEEVVVVVEEAPKEEKKKEKRKVKAYMPEVLVLSAEEEEAKKKRQIVNVAVQLLQNQERARQSRLYFADVYNKKKDRETQLKKKQSQSDQQLQESGNELINTQLKAAVGMQKLWRGHTARKIIKEDEIKRRIIIQMTEPSWKSTEEYDKLQRTVEKRREFRDQQIKNYIKANLDEKDRVLRVIGPGLFEDIGDEIREWFYQWYLRALNFDKYPSVEKGGTVLVVRGETMTPEEWIDEVERRRLEKIKLAKMGGKDKEKEKAELEKKKKEEAEKKKKEAEKKKKAALAKKKKKRMDFDYDFNQDTPVSVDFKAAFKEHRVLWDQRNEADNPLDLPYMDMITDQKCYEMQLEVREKVDEIMRLELDLLIDALARDRAKNKKGKKGKKGKGKKGKGKKGKKGKKKKDITGHRTTEDLFQELVDNGIIRTYPQVSLEQYRGDFSYKNWELRNLEFDPPATLGEVRQAVMMNCILPLGIESMVKPKSVVIVGAHQSGKHLLANAIFNETKCVLFDISPKVLAGKYPGKQGMKMLLHLINKMSRLLQPSIIYIDGAEKPFYKKVPKEERITEPKKMGTKLLKGIVKPIQPQDRILVLGITGQPWAGKPSGMKKAYQRVILIPLPDYNSVFMYWREMLMPFHGVDRNFNFTALTALTKQYPLSSIRSATIAVLTPRRIIRLSYEPLTSGEFLQYLMTEPDPISDKEWKKFTKWFSKTVLGKERAKLIALANVKREMLAKQAEKLAEKKNKKK